MRSALILVLCMVASTTAAQPVDDSRELVGFDRPEAWAMAYVISSTLMTGFGATPALDAGAWMASAELGHVPKLNAQQQQVGLGGIKGEDLNKSPVFGRGRIWLGLPAGFVAELGYTPPLEIDGVRPTDLFAIGIGRRWVDRGTWSFSTRLHAQAGSAHGDITCSADVAASTSPVVNPFRCVEPSDDRIKLRYHAFEATVDFGAADSVWRGHASAGVARMEPRVQVNARTQSLISRPQLAAQGIARYLALGAMRRTAEPWELGGELLYVPLNVRREAETSIENDPFWSLRLIVRYRFQ